MDTQTQSSFVGDGGSPPDDGPGYAAGRWGSGWSEREPFLIRARRISALTVPCLFREIGANETTDERTPWQSLTAEGVNNLSNRVVMALYPSGVSFIDIKESRKELLKYTTLPPDQRGKLKGLILQGLAKVKQEFTDAVAEDADRAVHYDTTRHLIVGGNHCEFTDPKTGKLTSYPLEEFMTWRDRSGNLFEWIIQTPLAYQTLPPDIKKMIEASGTYGPKCGDTGEGKEMCTDSSQWANVRNPIWSPINVYTHGELVGDQWCVHDEAWGEIVPGSQKKYPKDKLPWNFIRLIALKGENYGRSYCEDYEGDIQTYDAVNQVLTEGGAVMAKLIWLVKPGAATNKKAFSEAANGAVLTGDPEDVTTVKADKQADLTVVANQIDRVEKRLERIFIMNQAATRDAERVTAEEIRFMIQQLENTLGGIYSNLVVTWQRPYAEQKMEAVQRRGDMTTLPKGTIKVTILTGDAALARETNGDTLMKAVSDVVTVFTPPVAERYMKVGAIIDRMFTSRVIDTDGILMSDDEVAAQQAQEQKQALMEKAAAPAVTQMGQMAQNSQQAALAPPTEQPAQGGAPQ